LEDPPLEKGGNITGPRCLDVGTESSAEGSRTEPVSFAGELVEKSQGAGKIPRRDESSTTVVSKNLW